MNTCEYLYVFKRYGFIAEIIKISPLLLLVLEILSGYFIQLRGGS